MFRYKKVIGRGFHARRLPTRKTEVTVACKVINIMTSLGMPGCLTAAGKGEIRPPPDFCTKVT
jgi:hypothetical protein